MKFPLPVNVNDNVLLNKQITKKALNKFESRSEYIKLKCFLANTYSKQQIEDKHGLFRKNQVEIIHCGVVIKARKDKIDLSL